MKNTISLCVLMAIAVVNTLTAQNVGIGTAAPSEKLHISNGDGSAALFGPNSTWNAYLYVGASANKISANRAQVITTNGNLHLDAASSSNTYINFYSETNTFINPQGGNVGIGNASPSFKLDVTGTGRYTGQLTIPLTPSADASAASKKYVDDQISGSDDWDRSGSNIFNNNTGNVGIGTSSPGTKLEVAGTARIRKDAHTAGASSYHMELYSPNSGDANNEVSLRFHQGGQYYGQIRYRSGGFRFTQGNNDNLVKINAGEAYFLGNVGIGAPSPSAQLHTTGTVRFANYSNGLIGVDASGNLISRSLAISGSGLNVSNANGVSGNPTFNLDYGSASTGGPRPQGSFGQFENHGTYTDFNTTPNYWGWNYVQGNTNAPNTTSSQWYRGIFSLGGNYNARGSGGYSLELAYPRYNHSTAGVWMRTVENGSIGGWTRIDAGVNNDNFIRNQTAADQGAGFRINGNGLFNGGNVGIGTPSPAEKIHVSAGNNSYALFGPNSSWNSYLYVGAGPDKTAANRAQVISTNGNLHLDAGTGQHIYIGNYNSAKTYISPGGGNVGVGNTNPGAKLDVSGNIKANGNSTFATNDNSSTSYSVAALELRESNYGANNTFLPPRLSFHWGGVVASQIAIESNGTIAIRNNPGTGYEKFRCLTVTSNGIRETSDERLKNNIDNISGALDKVQEMRGVTYNWDQNIDRNEGLDETLQYGLIAQELEKVIPELVSTDEDGWKSIEYSHLVPVLIEAMKELRAEKDREIQDLKSELHQYKALLDDIDLEKLKKDYNKEKETFSANTKK